VAVAAPIVGQLHTSYASQEWWALAIVVGLGLILVLVRRYCAARSAKWPVGQALLFAVVVGRTPRAGQSAVSSRGLLTGSDNRYSTSKFTAALWTGVVAYFFVAMALVLGFDQSRLDTLFGSTSPLYLVFLGGPFAAAVIAKAVVSDASASGSAQKSQAGSPRAADVFSDDDGNTDLVDLQYVLFNLIVALIVLVEFLHSPAFGAPAVPSILAGLTGASAATYVANKGLTTSNPPSITRFTPDSVRPGGRVVALGANFIAAGDDHAPTVVVGGSVAAADPVSDGQNKPPVADQVAFQVPAATPYGAVTVVVRTPSDLETPSATLQVVKDSMTVSLADPTTATAGGTFALYGAGFYNALDVDAQGVPVGNGAVAATVSLARQDPAGTEVPCEASGSDTVLRVTIPRTLVAHGDQGWFDVKVARGAQVVTPPIAIFVKGA